MCHTIGNPLTSLTCQGGVSYTQIAKAFQVYIRPTFGECGLLLMCFVMLVLANPQECCLATYVGQGIGEIGKSEEREKRVWGGKK